MLTIDLATALSASPIPQIAIGADERIIAINAAAEQLVGPEMVGRHYIRAVRQPSVLDEIESSLSDGTRRESRFLGRSGQREAAYRVTIAPLVTDDQSRAVILTFEDTSAIEDADKMRSDFIANLSHELRSPLTALMGFVETLRGAARDDPAGRERLLIIMEREGRRMISLVEDLLSLSKVEATERQRPSDLVSLPQLVTNVTERLSPMTAQLGTEITAEIPSGFSPIPGDAGQLEQVISNLVENALRYGGGTPVHIRLSGPANEPLVRGPAVRITVSDEGSGIAQHHIPRLTERFYRVDDHRSRAAGGTGLGLAIVKHIVNRHRGRLRIESKPGQGTTITVLLPMGTPAT
ncbi:MAG: two-component sensor histidine kinase [Marivivens sp.]|nr:two-component sensor histidine kinase [Marivivens sp.]